MIWRCRLRHVLLCLAAVPAGLPVAAPGGEPPRPDRAPPPLSTVYDFGATGDGVADDTDALERAVASQTGEIRLPRGTYRITRPIRVQLDRVGFTSFIGGGTARIVMAGAGPALRLVGTHQGTASPASVQPNVWQRQRTPMIDGLEIVGDHEEACGIEAVGTMQLIVTRVTIRHTLHAIHLVERNRNVIISDCHLYENWGVGLYLDDVNLHQINVTGCHISYNDGGGIVVRAGNVRNLHVSGCDIEGNMAPDKPPTANVLIDCTGGAAGTAEVAITGSTIQHSHDSPDSANIRYIGTDAAGRPWGNVSIADNVLSDVVVNVDIQKARGISIAGNTFWKGVEHNLRITDSYNILVGPNVFDRNPRYQDQRDAGNALLLRNCQDCTLTGLHVNGVSKAPAGLVLESCRRMNLVGLTILDCDNAGLLLKDVSASRVSDCLLRNDREDAADWVPLKLVDSSGNMIEDNLLGEARSVHARPAADGKDDG